MSVTPQGPGWWQASDGNWYPPQAMPSAPPPPQKSGFAQGLGIGTGCLVAAVVTAFLAFGGCAVLVAIGANNAGNSHGSGGVDRGIASADASADFVSVTNSEPDVLGFVYLTVTVRNTSEKRSDYYIEISIESPDGGTKYEDTIVVIRNVEPGQTASDKSLPVNADRIPGAFKMKATKFQRTAS